MVLDTHFGADFDVLAQRNGPKVGAVEVGPEPLGQRRQIGQRGRHADDLHRRRGVAGGGVASRRRRRARRGVQQFGQQQLQQVAAVRVADQVQLVDHNDAHL